MVAKVLTRVAYSGHFDNGSWDAALAVPNAPSVDPGSGLAVVADKSRNLSILYVVEGDSKYTELSDPFKGSQ
jgi:hypothetical protein